MEKTFPEVFHLGLPKTGTSTIQHVLNNDDRINLIRYPFFSKMDWWSDDFNLCDSNKVNVLSNENQLFLSGKQMLFHSLLSRIQRVSPDAQIIVTLREQRGLVISRYKYAIKYRVYSDLNEWLYTRHGLDIMSNCMYYNLYKVLNSFFPSSQIHFLLFEDLKNDYESFLKSFYKIIGLEKGGMLNVGVKKNVSLSNEELYLIKRLNAFKLFRGKYSEKWLKRKMVSIFRKMGYPKRKNFNDFEWGKSDFFKSLENDFKIENDLLAKENIVDRNKLKEYGYLLPG